MTDNLFDRRRIGKFTVRLDAIDSGLFPEMIRALGITIVRAETMYHMLAIEYIGISPHFEVIEQGIITPEYMLTAIRDGDEITFQAKKI